MYKWKRMARKRSSKKDNLSASKAPSINRSVESTVDNKVTQIVTPLSHSAPSQEASTVTAAPSRQLFPSKSPRARQKIRLKRIVKNWTISLAKDDTKHLAMTLFYVLVDLNGSNVKKATKLIGLLLGKSPSTIQRWKSNLM